MTVLGGVCVNQPPLAMLQPLARAHTAGSTFGAVLQSPSCSLGMGTAIARHAGTIHVVALEGALCGGRGLHLSDLTS